MPDSISWDEPDLRPPKYKTKELVDRDPETFYHDEGIIKAQTKRRNRIIQKNPHAYANGWNCGPAYEPLILKLVYFNGTKTKGDV